jgi:hypothetical protein
MNAFTPTPVPPFPPNPTIGQVFQQWVWNGSSWVCQGWGPMAFVNVFLVSGTYWPRPGLNFAVVECIGGGGGGGGAAAAWSSGSAGWVGGGGGGASGSYAKATLAAALLRGGVPFTIGAGGAAGTNSTNGGNGSATQFGLLCIASGGGGGAWNDMTVPSPSNAWGTGGGRNPAGITNVGDIITYGSAGSNGASEYWVPAYDGGTAWGGQGGGSFYGGIGVMATVNSTASQSAMFVNGIAGLQGSGGDGGVARNGIASGGAGGPGLCIVTEWCFGNTSIVEPCNPCAGQAMTEVPPGFQQGQGWAPNWGPG